MNHLQIITSHFFFLSKQWKIVLKSVNSLINIHELHLHPFVTSWSVHTLPKNTFNKVKPMHKSIWSTSTCFTPTSRCLCDSCWCWKTELPQMFSHWGSCWRWRDAWSGRGRALSCLVRERKTWREKGGGQKRKEEGGEVNQRALPLLMMKLYVQLIVLKRNILGLEIQPTDRETKRHGINTPFTLWIFFLCVCCEFVKQKERRWVQKGEVFNKTVSWHQSKSYSPKTALCLFPCSTPSPLGMCLYCSPLELNARGCTFIISSSTRWDMKQDQGEQWSEEIRAHIRLWSPANGKTEETCSRNRSTELPVFWGPTTMNLGSLSQVFSLDQMSLCRLSSHGF